jgi:hypothetical protein
MECFPAHFVDAITPRYDRRRYLSTARLRYLSHSRGTRRLIASDARLRDTVQPHLLSSAWTLAPVHRPRGAPRSAVAAVTNRE